VLPGTLLVGVVCVVVSRLTGFQPGYLYGVLLGVAFAGELARADAGREAVFAAVVMLVAAVAAWLVLGTLSPDDSSVAGIAIHTALGAIVVGGLEGVVFGMAPLRFLPGEKLWAWSRVIWAVVFGVGMFAFAHILINPESGYLGDTSRTPFFTVVALIVGFAAVSIGFWGYFRFRGERPPAATRDVPAA